MLVAFRCQQLAFTAVYKAVCRFPPLVDGGAEAVAVAFVVPLGVMVFGTPDDYSLMMGQRAVPEVLLVGDAKEWQVVIMAFEYLSGPENMIAVVGVPFRPLAWFVTWPEP